MKRDDPGSVGMQYTTACGLGVIGGYLNWKDCRLPDPLAGRDRGATMRHRPTLLPDNATRIIDAVVGAKQTARLRRPDPMHGH